MRPSSVPVPRSSCPSGDRRDELGDVARAAAVARRRRRAREQPPDRVAAAGAGRADARPRRRGLRPRCPSPRRAPRRRRAAAPRRTPPSRARSRSTSRRPRAGSRSASSSSISQPGSSRSSSRSLFALREASHGLQLLHRTSARRRRRRSARRACDGVSSPRQRDDRARAAGGRPPALTLDRLDRARRRLERVDDRSGGSPAGSSTSRRPSSRPEPDEDLVRDDPQRPERDERRAPVAMTAAV